MTSRPVLRSLSRLAGAAIAAALSCARVPTDRRTAPAAEPTPQPRHEWSKVFGDENPQGASAVAVDAAGNAYVVGGFERSFVDAAGRSFVDPRALASAKTRCWGVFVQKIDPAGRLLWVRHFEGLDGYVDGRAVAVSSAGKVVIAGRMMSSSLDFGDAPLRNANPPHNDVFVATFDSETGRLLWSRALGGIGNEWPPTGGISIDAAGHVHLVYSSESPPPPVPGTGPMETILVELAPDGALIRSTAIGGPGRNQAWGLAASSRGTVFVSLFRRSGREWEGRLLEVDASGRELWSRDLETGATGIAVGPGDVVYVAGRWRPPAGFDAKRDPGGSIYLGAFGQGGEPLWSRRLGKARLEGPQDLAVDRCGDVVLVGDYGGEPALDLGGGALPIGAGPMMIFLAGFDGRGDHAWSQGYRGTNTNFTRALAIAPGGDIWLAGQLYGVEPIDLGGGPLVQRSGDVLLAKWTRRARCSDAR